MRTSPSPGFARPGVLLALAGLGALTVWLTGRPERCGSACALASPSVTVVYEEPTITLRYQIVDPLDAAPEVSSPNGWWGPTFTGQDLSAQSWSYASLRFARFDRCDLRGTDLRQADLRGAQFVNCDLRGTLLDGADFRGAVYDPATRWPAGFRPEARGAKGGE